jgi:hypothetical protein
VGVVDAHFQWVCARQWQQGNAARDGHDCSVRCRPRDRINFFTNVVKALDFELVILWSLSVPGKLHSSDFPDIVAGKSQCYKVLRCFGGSRMRESAESQENSPGADFCPERSGTIQR